MASTPEAKVKLFLDKRMKEKYPQAWRYCPPGGAFGQAGVPDRLYLIDGVFVAVECKDVGKNPTALQAKCLSDIHRAGGVAAVLRGRDESKMQLIFSAIESKILSIKSVEPDSERDV